MPFGLPYQIDGVSLALTAHIGDWGTHLHVQPPANATPLILPGGASSVSAAHPVAVTAPASRFRRSSAPRCGRSATRRAIPPR
jgi:hypothetical protein